MATKQWFYPCPKCGKLEDVECCCIKTGKTVFVHCLDCGVNSEKEDASKIVTVEV